MGEEARFLIGFGIESDGRKDIVNTVVLGWSGSVEEGCPHAARAFQTVLAKYGIPSTVRQRRGIGFVKS